MNRKEFLAAIGISSATVILGACLGACSKSSTSDAITAPNLDFTLDLTSPSNATLTTNGGYLYSNGVIVAKTMAGNIIAVSQSCTHQGTSVQYQSSSNQFNCPNHGAMFSASGAVTNGPATAPLKQYIVTVTGNSVRVNG